MRYRTDIGVVIKFGIVPSLISSNKRLAHEIYLS